MNSDPSAIASLAAFIAAFSSIETSFYFAEVFFCYAQLPELFRMWLVAFSAIRTNVAYQSLRKYSDYG